MERRYYVHHVNEHKCEVREHQALNTESLMNSTDIGSKKQCYREIFCDENPLPAVFKRVKLI